MKTTTGKADTEIARTIRQKVINGEISCRDSEEVAAVMQMPMGQVGRLLDEMEISIIKCQLGLFGYKPSKKIVSPSKEVDPFLEAAIRNKLSGECLPCAAAWEIAAEFALAKIAVASVCETLGIKIKPCQLGAF